MNCREKYFGNLSDIFKVSKIGIDKPLHITI
jgi:hypothetical protein